MQQAKLELKIEVKKRYFTFAVAHFSYLVYIDGKFNREFVEGDEVLLENYLIGLGMSEKERQEVLA